jgi:hypothetical protein
LDPVINPKEFQASLAWVKFDLKLQIKYYKELKRQLKYLRRK